MLRAMMAETDLPVTVKSRIGIDDMDVETGLDRFVDTVAGAGVSVFYIHARKAWLNGLSPRENRTIPPLDYERVRRLAKRRGDLTVILNGGLKTADQALAEMDGCNGVMIGRAAYRTPYVMTEIAQRIFGRMPPRRDDVALAMADYADTMTKTDVSLHSITRHMLGLYAGNLVPNIGGGSLVNMREKRSHQVILSVKHLPFARHWQHGVPPER